MGAAALHRQAIVDTAIRLFRKQGYAATGLNQIVEESGAPKGSLYHYFPAGKEAIAEAAIGQAGAKVVDTLTRLAQDAGGDPVALYRRYVTLLAGWMQQSGFRDGCPITTTLLETAPQQVRLRDAGAQALAGWSAVISDALRRRGVPAGQAGRLGRVAVAALEGALVQVRVIEDPAPLLEVGQAIGELFEAALAGAAGTN